MNSVTTMILFVVCLSGILLMASSCDAVVARKSCDGMREVFVFYITTCRSLDRTLTSRRLNVEEPAKPNQTTEAASLYSAREKTDKPASSVAPHETPLSSPGLRETSSVETKLTDDRSLASAGEGSSEKGGMVGEGRHRFIRGTGVAPRYSQLYLCCVHGCDAKDFYERICLSKTMGFRCLRGSSFLNRLAEASGCRKPA